MSHVPPRRLLVLNKGSSSLKFALFEPRGLRRLARGSLRDLGGAPQLTLEREGGAPGSEPVPGPLSPDEAAERLLARLKAHGLLEGVTLVAHRIVHGGATFRAPAALDPATLVALRALSPWAPLHQDASLDVADVARGRLAGAMHVACFDTAFHADQPRLARLYALPRRLIEDGVVAYGFHGLSYAHVAGRLRRLDPQGRGGRAVVAHLGSGASLCALRSGASLATTMGFSTLDGVPMSTRCGAMDPGVILHLLQHRGLTPRQVSHLLYEEAGLLGLSGVSGDLRTLLASSTAEAAEAIDFFVYRVSREIGALAAVLGGIDTLVFTGGVGEGSMEVRARICAQAAWLGVEIDPVRNAAGAPEIGTGRVRVLVEPADEEFAMAEALVEAGFADPREG